jgi:predicted RNA-binding protein with PUA-like domain
MFFLLKTEPGTYSFADLQRDKQTIWDGVTNPAAVNNLREMKAGDQLIIYHTGDEKRAVGTATVISVDADDPKKPLVKIESGIALASPKTLAEMKADTRFKDSPLLRQSRLSVVPLTDTQHKFLLGSK